jgi:isocitrate/isopropylmalate dehydrogenase
MSRMATVACVTGAGTAPELMAEAMLALDAVGRLHGLTIDETHVTFGAVAVARAGQAVPVLTRAAVLAADAVLVAGAEEPALAEIMSELDLRAQVTRVRFGHDDDVAFVSPLADGAEEWTIETAFRIAESRTMRIAAVGDAPWNDLVDAVAAHHEHVHVEYLAPKLALPLAAFNASRFDVALVAPVWAEALVEIAAAPATARVAAHGLLAEHGPSMFVPAPDGGFALAGSGVVNPSSMLLAAAMMLEYGLDAPTAGATLAGAVSAVLVDGPRTPDLLHGGVGATSREFTSRVVSGFQLSQPWAGAA